MPVVVTEPHDAIMRYRYIVRYKIDIVDSTKTSNLIELRLLYIKDAYALSIAAEVYYQSARKRDSVHGILFSI